MGVYKNTLFYSHPCKLPFLKEVGVISLHIEFSELTLGTNFEI